MEKKSRKLALFLMCVYTASYVTRINFGAIVAEMVAGTGLSKDALSWSLTGAFITYGAGQLLSGWLGDRVQPKYLLSLGLFVSSAMNLVTASLSDPVAMAAVWCVNGLAQAFLWPPIVRLTANRMTKDDFKKSTVVVSYGITTGTILVYLVSPLIITLSGWRAVFIVSAFVGLVASALVFRFCPKTESETKDEAGGGVEEKKRGGWALVFSPVMIALMAAIVCQGALRDGVTTWMPSYISETYSLGTAAAILTGVLMPLFGMLCLKLSGILYSKALKNPMTCGGVIFGFGVVSAACLYFATGRTTVGSVIFSAALTGAMHGVNLILVCMVPGFFRGTGKVAFVSGALNTCTYIGSAASVWLVPIVAGGGDWSATVALWCSIAAVGCALTFIALPGFRRRFGGGGNGPVF